MSEVKNYRNNCEHYSLLPVSKLGFINLILYPAQGHNMFYYVDRTGDTISKLPINKIPTDACVLRPCIHYLSSSELKNRKIKVPKYGELSAACSILPTMVLESALKNNSISTEEYVEKLYDTCKFWISKDNDLVLEETEYSILNVLLSVTHQCGHYFNSDGVYVKVEHLADIPKCVKANSKFTNNRMNLNNEEVSYYRFEDGTLVDDSNMLWVIHNLKVGYTIESFIELLKIAIIFNKKCRKYTQNEVAPSNIELNSVLSKRPTVELVGENSSKTNFDAIAVTVWLVFGDKERTLEAIRKYPKDLNEIVLDCIDSYKPFKKYGVPITLFQILKATYNGNTIDYTLVLKSSVQKSVIEAYKAKYGDDSLILDFCD